MAGLYNMPIVFYNGEIYIAEVVYVCTLQGG